MRRVKVESGFGFVIRLPLIGNPPAALRVRTRSHQTPDYGLRGVNSRSILKFGEFEYKESFKRP